MPGPTPTKKTTRRAKLYLLPGVSEFDVHAGEKNEWCGFYERIKDIVLYSDSTPVELISGLLALAWGLWVGNPWYDLYIEYPKMYSGAAAVAPEALWGGIAFIAGSIQLIGVIYQKKKYRHHGAFLGVCLWAMASYAAYLSAKGTTALVFYPLLTLLSLWGFTSSAKLWGFGHE